MILPTRKKNTPLTHDVTHSKVWENWWKRPREESLGCVRQWCSQSRNGRTRGGNARSVAAEGAVVVGHGDGDAVSLPLLERQWSSLLLPTELRTSTTLRERERERVRECERERERLRERVGERLKK